MNVIPEWADVFGDQSTKTTTNESNLAGHYAYSPERWRLFDGQGTRLFPEYDSVPQYTHAGDYHELSPNAGETVIFETAERYRYVVQYELEATWALALNQELSGDDYIRWGYYDDSDGWFLEHNGSHARDAVDMVALRDGSEVYRTTTTIDTDDLLNNTRFGLETAWYDVSRQKWSQSYGKDGKQVNKTVGRESLFGERGPSTGNLHLRFEVNADANTSDLSLEAGSCALVTKGSGADNLRSKGKYYQDSVDDSGTWSPVRAYREIPEKGVINNQVLRFGLISYSQDTPVEAAILAFDKSNVTFSGTDSWGVPDVWNTSNTAMQTRSDVDTFADSSGSLVTTADDPGGFQAGYAVLAPTSGNQFQKGASEQNLGVKRNLPNGDVAVLLVNAGSAGDIGHVEAWEMDF